MSNSVPTCSKSLQVSQNAKHIWNVLITLNTYELLWHYGKLQRTWGEEVMEQKAFFLKSSRHFHFKLRIRSKLLDQPFKKLVHYLGKKNYFPRRKKEKEKTCPKWHPCSLCLHVSSDSSWFGPSNVTAWIKEYFPLG